MKTKKSIYVLTCILVGLLLFGFFSGNSDANDGRDWEKKAFRTFKSKDNQKSIASNNENIDFIMPFIGVGVLAK